MTDIKYDDDIVDLLEYLSGRAGPTYMRPEQIATANKCDPKWIAFGFGNVAKITDEGRQALKDIAAHKKSVRTHKYETNLKHAQVIVDEIVKRMVAAHYPVECTHKAGHKPDYIPCDSYGGWSDKINNYANGVTFFESNLASVLIGGWHSKGALVQLLAEIRRYTMEQNSK